MKSNDSIKLAIADDQMAVRLGLMHLIRAMGNFTFVADASNGKELIDKMESLKCLPDICIVDIRMPVMDGYTTCRHLRQKWPEKGIMALSSFNEEYNIIKMLEAGADCYLDKWSSPQTVHDALLSLYSKSGYQTPGISGRYLHMIRNRDKASGKLITREEEILLDHMCHGRSYKETGRLMNASQRTLEGYRDSISRKTGWKGRNGLISLGFQIGLGPHRDKSN